MATRSIVPRADNEGGIGTSLKRWATGHIVSLLCSTVNALTLTAQSVGFTISGGTTSKILTVAGDATVSGSNTGDQDLTDYALKSYVDSAVVGLLDDCGNYDASGDVYPSSGGSGDAGAILKGDLWIISVAGTLGGVSVTASDQIRALCDTPGQTSSNWAIMEGNIGYVPANDSSVLHKSTAGEIAAMTEKTTLDDADVFIIEDSENANAKKKVLASTIINNNLVVSDGMLFIKEA